MDLYFYRNRKKEIAENSVLVTAETSPFYQWTVHTHCLPEINTEYQQQSLFRVRRFENRLKPILTIIGSNAEHNSIVGIEGYSFDSRNGNAYSTLCELGGCLRWLLCEQQHDILEIPPSRVKKLFANLGHASKDEMYTAYAEQYVLPSLYSLLGLKETQCSHTPHPIEDMVDALAVAVSTIMVLSQ